MQEYEILKRIGKRGGFAEVFLCRHKETKREVVDKRFTMEYLSAEDCSVALEEAKRMERFSERERHPHVVFFIEHYQHDIEFHLYMEYCPGESLRGEITRRTKDNRNYRETKMASYLHQMASGLAFLHANKMLHRDLKPENVLKNEDGILKIVDFGVAAALTLNCNMRNSFMKTGTLNYMARDVLSGKDYDSACDMWSLGVITYELITLHLPFQAKSTPELLLKIIRNEFDPIEAAISNDLRNVVTNMLSKEPSNRPSSDALAELDFLQIAHKVSRSRRALRRCRPLLVNEIDPRLLLLVNSINLTLDPIKDEVMNKTTEQRVAGAACILDFLETLPNGVELLLGALRSEFVNLPRLAAAFEQSSTASLRHEDASSFELSTADTTGD